MNYDLEHPPVVIRRARWKLLLLLLLCAGFTAIGLLMLRDPQAWMQGLFVAAVFGLGVGIAVWALFVPAWLELSPSGLRWFTGRKTVLYSWQDFREFHVYAPTTFSRHVGYVLSERSGKRTKFGTFSKNMFGLDGGFGGTWSLRTERLVELLNAARSKWGVAIE